jgi:hypothetical protein
MYAWCNNSGNLTFANDANDVSVTFLGIPHVTMVTKVIVVTKVTMVIKLAWSSHTVKMSLIIPRNKWTGYRRRILNP